MRSIKRAFSMFGLDPRKILSFRNVPKFLLQRLEWSREGGDITHSYPILSDYDDNAGNAKGHYFHQDLLVANFINQRNPKRHIDVGSRIDGFVAHVASFREIEVFDIRNLSESKHKNIKFVQKDLMIDSEANITDSLSCLHAIEHFGLGRYGDPIVPDGHILGLNNIVGMLKKNGILYVSFPIGMSDEIHFNAHRVFSPESIFGWDGVKEKLELLRFDWVDDSGDIHVDTRVEEAHEKIRFGCGIYTFRKCV